MKKIFFITNEMSGGGAERVMSVLANYLNEHGFNVNFLVLQKLEESYKIDSGVSIYQWRERKKGDAIGQIKFLRSFMKKNPGAIFVSFFTHQNLYSIIASLGLKIKVVVSERNAPKYSIHGFGKKVMRNILYASPLCDKIVFQTIGAQKYFSNKIQRKCIIIANPLKTELPEIFKGVRSKKIVSIGRFEKQKNHNMLIEAFAEFLKIHDDYRLVLYGKGSLEKELREKSKELGIGNKVDFEGFHQNVHELVLDAAMFVLPSDYEGLSNSMLEAMAIGLPVICTDCPPGGAREYITNKVNGILVPVGDAHKTCEAMCYMAEHEDEANKMGERAYELRERLDSHEICRQWEKLFI